MEQQAIESTWGTPALQAFQKMAQAAADHHKSVNAEAMIAKLAEFNNKYKDLPNRITEVAAQIHHCYVRKPFNKKKRILELALSGDANILFENVIIPYLKQMKGYRRLHGIAPKGDLERKVQEIVESLSV